MKYTIKAHPTMYSGVRFRSRLEARWAAFFDLVAWPWEYEPLDLVGWVPDFRVRWPCQHSCNGYDDTGAYSKERRAESIAKGAGDHILLVEVKPYDDPAQFNGHPMWDHNEEWADPHIVGVGNNPGVSTDWGMSHGSGGFQATIRSWLAGDGEAAWPALWREAGNTVQWRAA